VTYFWRVSHGLTSHRPVGLQFDPRRGWAIEGEAHNGERP
jgi:hypothetical protein